MRLGFLAALKRATWRQRRARGRDQRSKAVRPAEYCQTLKWDGKPRAASWLIEHLGEQFPARPIL